MKHITRILITATFLVSGMAMVASAHQMAANGPEIKYPAACCSNKDCHPAKPGTILFTPEGWYITTNHQTIPDDKVRQTPSGASGWFVCHYQGDDRRNVVTVDGVPCIWKPPGQF